MITTTKTKMTKKFDIKDMKEGSIAVLYNACYGGWSPSKKAAELYNMRMTDQDPSFVHIDGAFDMSCLERHDPLLIEIYQELGDEFDSSKVSNTKVAMFSNKYKDFYVIREYDGLETVSIDITRYKLHKLTEKYNKIKEILSNDTENDHDKIHQLKQICEKKQK